MLFPMRSATKDFEVDRNFYKIFRNDIDVAVEHFLGVVDARAKFHEWLLDLLVGKVYRNFHSCTLLFSVVYKHIIGS